MSADHAVAFALFAVTAAITPGPSNLILTSMGASVGIRRGLPCLFGVVLGMGLMLFIVAFGLGSLVVDHPTILRVLKWGGAGFLLWLAWKIAASRAGVAALSQAIVGFRKAAALQWVNPKSWLVSVGAAGAYLHAGTSSAFMQAFGLGGLFAIVALPCCFTWLAFGSSLQRFLTTERASRRFNVAMGVTLAASVALFLHSPSA